MILDKTGTITEGSPTVTDILVTDKSYTEKYILTIASSIESRSEHPLAQAIVDYAIAQEIDPEDISDFQAIAGHGIEAKLEDHNLLFGNQKLMFKKGVFLGEFADEAKTPMYLAIDNKLAAIIAVSDPIKEDSIEAIKRLQSSGIRVVMLTGDNRATANAVAKKVGIKEVFAEVLPEDKSNKGSLHGLADAIAVSKATLRNIKQNLFGAFIYNVAGVPFAAGLLYPFFGLLLNPVIAGAAMAFSSLTVVSNANRLRLFKPQEH